MSELQTQHLIAERMSVANQIPAWTKEIFAHPPRSSLPGLSDSSTADPALKGWAIFSWPRGPTGCSRTVLDGVGVHDESHADLC